jgi:hypothetical protein
MQKIIILAGLVAVSFATPTLAKDKQELAPMQLQSMQTKEFETTKDQAFGAVMTVLQDAGYRIQSGDIQSGLITGVGSTTGKLSYSMWSGFGKKKLTPIVSAFIEQMGPVSKIRLNFVMAKVKSTVYGSQPQDEEPIIESAIYQDAFEKISQVLFVRQSLMSASAPATKPLRVKPAEPAAQPQK